MKRPYKMKRSNRSVPVIYWRRWIEFHFNLPRLTLEEETLFEKLFREDLEKLLSNIGNAWI